MRSISKLLFGGVVALSAVSCAKAQDKAVPAGGQTRQANSLQGAADWRVRMQQNHNADSSVEQQVRRLTQDLGLTAVQQNKVRQLSRVHNERIQAILDTAPPTLTYADFQTQVHSISQQFHDSVNAILTPRQLDLMKAMVGRLDSGSEARHAP
jgi:L-fucose isomerase-like protein